MITILVPFPFVFKDMLTQIKTFNDVYIKAPFGAKMYLYARWVWPFSSAYVITTIFFLVV